MDEKMKEVEQHIWKSHPAWNLAYTGWYQCEVCKKEYHSKVIPPIFPRGICEIRILRFHISALESQLKEAKHQIDFQIKNYLADHELMSEYRIKWEQSEAKIKEKEKKIEELEKENIQFARWVQINASETGEQKVRAEKAEARIKELEEKQKWIDEVGRPDHPDDERPWVPAYLDCRVRIKELEEEIKDILKESTISYVVEKRLKELIKKGE